MTRPDMQRNRMELGWLGKLCLIVRLLVTNWGVPRQATNNNGRGGLRVANPDRLGYGNDTMPMVRLGPNARSGPFARVQRCFSSP